MMREFSFATDTATMCIFDVECLKHRLADDADWSVFDHVEEWVGQRTGLSMNSSSERTGC